jgi:hypothetical protein
MLRLWSTYGMEPMGAVHNSNQASNGGYVFGKDGMTVGIVFYYEVETKNSQRSYVCVHTPEIEKDREPTNFFRSGTVDGLMSIIKRDKAACFDVSLDHKHTAYLPAMNNIDHSVTIGSESFSIPSLDQQHALDLLDVFAEIKEGGSVKVSETLSTWEAATRLSAATAIANKRENQAIKDNFRKSCLVVCDIPYICDHRYEVIEMVDGEFSKSFRINEIKELAIEYPIVFGIHNMIRAKSPNAKEYGLMYDGNEVTYTPLYDVGFNLIRKAEHIDQFFRYTSEYRYHTRCVIVPTNLHTSRQKEEARDDESIAPSLVSPRSKSSFF